MTKLSLTEVPLPSQQVLLRENVIPSLLLLDADINFQEVMRFRLTRLGFQVLQAHSVAELPDLLKMSFPDLWILTDATLHEVTPTLRQILRDESTCTNCTLVVLTSNEPVFPVLQGMQILGFPIQEGMESFSRFLSGIWLRPRES